ncbi:OOP family OmpA-OmpF porin [Pseudomonas sp. TE3786]
MPTLSLRVTVPILLVSSVLSGCVSTSSNGDAVVNQGNWPICTVFGLICYALDGDDDSDGVHDRRDVCADTPANTPVNNSGCPLPQYPAAAPPPPPEPEQPAVQNETIVLSDAGDVLFAFDSAELSESAKSALVEIGKRLSGASLVSVQVAGHTDSKGSDAYNQKLSERRAQSVSTFLTSQGIPASKLSVVGYGESQPVADNNTDGGRAQNRRVELHVTR